MVDLVIDNIPDLIEKALTGTSLIVREALSSKDKEILNRMKHLLNQLDASLRTLKKVSSTAEGAQAMRGLDESAKQIQQLLLEFQEFSEQRSSVQHHKAGKSTLKILKRAILNNDDASQYLEEMVERFFHAVKLFRFSVSLSGCVLFQKNNSLARLIADPVACDQWIKRFGTVPRCVSNWSSDSLLFCSFYVVELKCCSFQFCG